jgi:SAM-dependent methyltransferase
VITLMSEVWPPDELERVTECPVCGWRGRSVLYGELRDLQFQCAPGLWTFHRCLHCSSAYLDPRPTRSSIGRAYSSYYTHELGSGRGGALGKVQLRLCYGFLNQTQGYRLSPAWRAGAWAVRVLPQQRGRALKEVRRLPRRAAGMRVLDVGCGSGGFLDLMRWQGWIVQGLEPDHEAVDLARRRGLDVMHGTVDRLADYPA